MEERAGGNENREMTAGSKRIHTIQAHYERKWLNLLGNGLTQEINGDGGSI